MGGRMPFNQGSIPSPFTSPMASNNGYQSSMAPGNGYQSPMTPRRPGLNDSAPRTTQGPPVGRRRGHMAFPSTPNHESNGRPAFREAPTAYEYVTPSIVGIPEVQSVQEFAFRAGQADHGVICDRIAASPFAAQYDPLWLEFYVLGKACGGKPATTEPGLPPTGFQNFAWSPLINPYTQDLQRPGGTYDAQWARKMCGLALGCMAALIATIIQRKGDWKRTVCDVPGPIKQAIQLFPDLQARYEALLKDSKETVAGGRPYGY